MSVPSLLLVHAHPDDESLWTGGTIARHVAADGDCTIVTCTWTAGTGRYDELTEATEVLGSGSPVTLGYGDLMFGEESAPGRPRLCDADPDDVSRDLVAHIRTIRPEIVITYDAYGIYGHPDHVAAHRVTVIAVEAAAAAALYPETGQPWQVRSLYLSTIPRWVAARVLPAVRDDIPDPPLVGTPEDAIDLSLDVSAQADVKWKALSAHRSELARSRALRRLAELPRDQRDLLLNTEYYLRRDLVTGGADLLGS
ncbi:PIG-L family deacetylase [Williamsia sterculiae]|uniref:N-acetyl-1-D-myo-inositol-2-amino-2-deoxy-alpha-D-glucopyranoside deacetylase n=1 Tax=Williamsia sterculiae TaxID=1344003 RepID=A0A1N7H2C5_9NOCA|nr:PIG-L family deacetylase [Williamsia sterculiae]SIS18989.1 N-acetyl-1-D-myo-inositol-2-amino-2-deoxy-alpha-D-glucopyranoside deacetylase [Williamsia sterculiae]